MIMDKISLALVIVGALNWGGIGLFRFDTVAWICGLKHIRETIPYPRMMGRLFP